MKLNGIAKYGTYFTCLALFVVGIFTWLIKYPDTVSTRSELTGTNAPKPIIARQNLRLIKLLKHNNEEVNKGDLIGILETTANFEEVLRLEQVLQIVDSSLTANSIDRMKNALKQSFHHLGELQGDYQSFIQAYIPYRDYVLGDYVVKKRAFLQKDLNIVKRSRSLLQEQRKLQQEDLGLTQTNINNNKKLLDQKLISEQEYRDLSSQYINKQMSEPQIKSGIIGNEAQVNALNKEMVEIDKQILTQRSLFEQAVNQLKTRINMWKQEYLLTANSTGKLVFTSFLEENQNLEAGKVLANIIPSKSDYYLKMLIPQANFGKVAIGQNVILKFDAYPWQEYGTVMGQINYISPIPVDSGYYLAKIILPNNLMTNYRKQVPFVEGLTAQSEIITKDMRLAESLYYDLVKTIKK